MVPFSLALVYVYTYPSWKFSLSYFRVLKVGAVISNPSGCLKISVGLAEDIATKQPSKKIFYSHIHSSENSQVFIREK